MKALERFLIAFCIVSSGFQLAGVTGSASIVLVSFLSLAGYYFYLGFAVFNSIPFKGLFKRESYKDTNVLRIIGAVVSGFSISAIVVGVLFKLFSWEGANQEIIAGVAPCLIILVVGVFRYRKSNAKYYLEVFYRLGFYTGLGIIFIFY